MPRPTTDRFEQRKATRAKLVEAARKLFSTSGYDHATVDDISAAAGYSKGAYYFHFSTKDDVLFELLRIWTEDRTTTLAAQSSDGAASGESLRHLLESFFSYDAAPQWPGVLLEFWAQAIRNPEVSKRLTQAYGGWRKSIAAAFESASLAGSLRLTSPEDAASVALAAHDGYAVQVAIGSRGSRAMTAADLADSLVAPLEVAAGATVRRSALG
ncbi:MAG: TetR/AcrR family transcriptional regulator [Chloroflexota bacterium]|nr:TetR/AcrR family transcriptional regulator [Chloroflexota bacterium]